MQTKIVTLAETNSPLFLCQIRSAAEVIRKGGLVAFPTETVYGLGADGTKEGAASAIYQAKGRPSDNPLILHIAEPSDAVQYAYTGEMYRRLSEKFMPGPLTVIMPARDNVPRTVTAGLPTVAIRCPVHPAAHALIREAGVAIAAPSANRSGSPSPTCARYVIEDLDGRVDMILDGGKCQIGLESTIVKIVSDDELLLLRPGGITTEDLRSLGVRLTISDAVTGELKEGQVAESPGMKYRHYAPAKPLILLKGNEKSRQKYIFEQKEPCAVLCYREEMPVYASFLSSDRVFDMGSRDDAASHCRTLFTLLREADLPFVERIFAPLPSKEGLGLALYNRMIRAAAHQIVEVKDE